MSASRDRRGLIAIELRNAAGLAIEFLGNGSLFAIRDGDVLIFIWADRASTGADGGHGEMTDRHDAAVPGQQTGVDPKRPPAEAPRA